MKKISILIITIMLVSIYPSMSKAVEPITYENEVNVSVHLASNLTLTANGSYQLLNKDTNNSTLIPSGTSLSVSKDSTGVVVSFTSINEKSAKGFDLQELTGESSLSLAKLSNGLTYRGSFFLRPNGNQVQVINILDMEDYLKGVVPSEMPASWHKEALKAQAIAARSYAANTMMLTSTAASQVYRGYTGEDPRTNAAIQETAGLLVKYNGKPIQAFFHSTSGGRTANVSDVWNSDQKYYPYLVSVEDPYEVSPYSNWTETYSPSTLLKSFGVTDLNATLLDITYSKPGANGEVKSVTLKTSAGDKTLSGNELVIRKAFPVQNAAVYNALYSTWFDIDFSGAQRELSVQTTSGTSTVTDMKGQKVQTTSGQVTLSDSKVSIQTTNGIITNEGTGITTVTVKGKGWGHRVGMSQYGARGFAEKGWTAEQILTHYFKGTTVAK
ncbi:SpoIID/LytB domain-containing protein [Cytobacillus sp. FJAT-54145]|uniref:SpoIID/LytB domain-containing protein n=1 Tax=Cytobacillus spartinae TaxID=3299023 RepID=A0ABW6KDQ6_9BACI